MSIASLIPASMTDAKVLALLKKKFEILVGFGSVFFNHRHTPINMRLKRVSQNQIFDVSLNPPQHCEPVSSISVGGK